MIGALFKGIFPLIASSIGRFSRNNFSLQLSRNSSPLFVFIKINDTPSLIELLNGIFLPSPQKSPIVISATLLVLQYLHL